MIRVKAHTCYLGKTGYAAHARSFFRELSNFVELRVRNFTWDDSPTYLNDTDLKIVDTISLRNSDGTHSDHPINQSFPQFNWRANGAFEQDIDLVLMDMDHHYFYEEYSAKIKIAYTVWESTELPMPFFNQLLKFDYLWVVTEWHRQVAINQGYPANRVFVVNEGVDLDIIKDSEPCARLEEYSDNRFKFLFFGRWDYRKAVPEIVQAFINTFSQDEEVDLILSADNPYSIDGLNSTEERLAHYGILDSRIKIKHFPKREEYLSYIKTGNVLVSCARSEGWNIPLIEAMAAGTPAIYSNWGAQLEFAKDIGIAVKIKDELPASLGADLGFAKWTPGKYAEPDFEDLERAMRDAYENYTKHKAEAERNKTVIQENFSWREVTKRSMKVIEKIIEDSEPIDTSGQCVVIMSHADSVVKLDALKKCIVALKKKGYCTIVSSHIDIPSEITKLIDYLVVDYDNPIIPYQEFEKLSNTVPIHYIRTGQFNLSYSFEFNHGYAAFRLIKNGIAIAHSNNFKITHFVNYDYEIRNKETLAFHANKLDECKVFSYGWTAPRSINSGIFTVVTEPFMDAIRDINDKRDYFKFPNVVILEDFLYEVIAAAGLTIKFGEKTYLEEGNLLNSIVLPTYPQITIDEGQCYVYLCEDEKGLLYIMGWSQEVAEFEVKIATKGYEETVKFGNYGKFIKISKEMLESGIQVTTPDKKVLSYNLNTKRASVTLLDTAAITELSGEVELVPVTINFIDGAFIEIGGKEKREYLVKFIDSGKNEIVYSTTIGNNCWAKCNRAYWVDWKIEITDILTGSTQIHGIDLNDKLVLISIESASLGDSIAWFAHVEEFQRKTGCNLVISTFNNQLFEEQYPQIKFVKPGSVVQNLYAKYRIGWFYDGDKYNESLHPRDFKQIPLQQTTTDILGLPFSNRKPRITVNSNHRLYDKKYVCLGFHSTAQAKYWNNPIGWQELVDFFIDNGYDVLMLSKEEDGYMGNHYPNGVIVINGIRTLDSTINYLKHASMFVGIGSGLSWLAWAVGVPTVLISGFSTPITEMSDNQVIRIFNRNVCNGCFNRLRLDASDWNWCPDHKGTARQFECTRSIHAKDVISAIQDFWKNGKVELDVERVVHESYNLGMVQNYSEIIGAAEFFKNLKVKNFMEIGTDQGGTFAIWSKLSEDGIRISLDLPHGNFGRTYDLKKRDEYLTALGSNVHMVHGNSHLPEMKDRVLQILGETKVDFLFIDGDHTYEGVKADFEMYREFVKPGGWIGFHDIKDTEFHRRANCRVDQLWQEFTLEKIEFCDPSSEFGGIGFIRV